ncbi:MAG: type II toxin-antitoxin system HicA family toxin [Bacteroidota bacterium]
MKRNKLIKHLKQHGCQQLREGANHTVFSNPVNNRQSTVGRHRELSDILCNKVCQQLGIPKIK